MKTQTNLMIAIAFLIGFSSLSYAESMEQERGERPARPEFSTVDVNSDGEISFDEFSQQELPHGDAQTVFDHIDADGNGTISEDEFTSQKPPRPPKN